MTLTADQYAKIARGYAAAAADPSVAEEAKAEFARKAEWFQFLGEREEKRTLTSASSEHVSSETSTTGGLRISHGPLWLAGAALYLISTLMLISIVTPFGGSEDKTLKVERNRAPEPALKSAELHDVQSPDGSSQTATAANKPHALSPDQPPYEAPGLITPSPAEQEDSTPPSQIGASPASGTETAEGSEILLTTTVAKIREGPSTRFKVLGTATPGAELEVLARESGWVQFVDPSSGNRGWIHSSLVAPETAEGEAAAATRSEGSSSTAAPRRKATKGKSKTRSTPQVAEQRPSKPFAAEHRADYADLPDDEEFFRDTSRKRGLFPRRRMLREGLLSPGFIPPR